MFDEGELEDINYLVDVSIGENSYHLTETYSN